RLPESRQPNHEGIRCARKRSTHSCELSPLVSPLPVAARLPRPTKSSSEPTRSPPPSGSRSSDDHTPLPRCVKTRPRSFKPEGAVGRPGLITAEHVNEHAGVIDVGTNPTPEGGSSATSTKPPSPAGSQA